MNSAPLFMGELVKAIQENTKAIREQTDVIARKASNGPVKNVEKK